MCVKTTNMDGEKTTILKHSWKSPNDERTNMNQKYCTLGMEL